MRQYEYDGYGNRVMRNLHPYSSGELLAAKAATKYDYSPGDWQDQLVSVNGSSITYDDMGNPTSYRGKNLTWEGKQLVEHKTVSYVGGSALTISFTYDENGIRQTKTSARSAGSAGSVTTRYHYNGKALMGQSDGTHTLLFSYDGNGNAASVRFNGTDYYYLYNGQGDVVKLIDGNGATQVEYTYDTWGACTTTGAMAGTLGLKNPFRYRGYVYDSDTALYYLESRYYDPETGRFLSADVYLSTNQGVLGNNAFIYCGNNPVVRRDEGGELWDTVFDVISLVGSVAEVIVNPASGAAWAALGADILCTVVPGLTGGGAIVKAVTKADDVVDAAKTIYKAADKASDIRRASGSYEIIYKSGKNYVGKGGYSRMLSSAQKHAADYTDEVVSLSWKRAPNPKAAFNDEYRRMLKHGLNKELTYNKIWSPGRSQYRNNLMKLFGER